ncbi:MAG TPA: hypothetical protein EYN66_15845 [Myxococcales bacterium]|nr:hypothetical protein [Myxococcales bacterium]
MGKRMTLRGIIPGGSLAWTNPIRLQLNNGDFTRNYKVVEWEIFPSMNRLGGTSNMGSYTAITSNSNMTNVCLALEESGLTAGDFRFNDSRQIAWAQGYGTTPQNFRQSLDPNHIIVQDLWLGAYAFDINDGSTETTTVDLNYRVVVEVVSSSMNEAVLQLIKEQSQD